MSCGDRVELFCPQADLGEARGLDGPATPPFHSLNWVELQYAELPSVSFR